MGEQRTGGDLGIDPLWDTADVALFLKVPARTVQGWRACAKGPKFYRVGKHARYRRSDVLAWLESDAATEVA
jgi:cytochrome c2